MRYNSLRPWSSTLARISLPFSSGQYVTAGRVPEAARLPDSLTVRISENAISASLSAQIFNQQVIFLEHGLCLNHAESALKPGHNPREHLALKISTDRKRKTGNNSRIEAISPYRKPVQGELTVRSQLHHKLPFYRTTISKRPHAGLINLRNGLKVGFYTAYTIPSGSLDYSRRDRFVRNDSLFGVVFRLEAFERNRS